jgi:dsDNA-specific endonuclease/ATPase MutS2
MNLDQDLVQLQEVIDELAMACEIKPFQIKDIPSLINKSGGFYQSAIYTYARLILDGKSTKMEAIEELKRTIIEKEKEFYEKVDSQRSSRYYDNILAEFRYNYKLCKGDFNKAVHYTVEMMDCAEEDVHRAIEIYGRGLFRSYQEKS